MNPLLRRLARLESVGSGDFAIVKLYAGMSKDEALLLRFGPEGPPRGAELLFISGGFMPFRDMDYHWAEKRGTPEYEATWARLYLKDPREDEV